MSIYDQHVFLYQDGHTPVASQTSLIFMVHFDFQIQGKLDEQPPLSEVKSVALSRFVYIRAPMLNPSVSCGWGWESSSMKDSIRPMLLAWISNLP